MRLHRLEVTAFGPFAETVTVDFDRLAGAGLFLLSGPTGSGKTSVLDAVCFALYGDVPGDRATAKRLRSDHADPSAAPSVMLEATLSGRRFRLTRSPAWERPKRRGSGTTTQQASVVVQEWITEKDDWTTHTTRLDEAGHLIGDLIGMTLGQFTQVAMLPQGHFQEFLRAKSEERKQLLQKLFRTDRFADVETWLRHHRVELRRQSEAAHQEVADTVSRISEAADADLPEAWDLHDLTPPAEAGELTRWGSGLTTQAREAHDAAATEAATSTAAEHDAREHLNQARTMVERRERIDAATAEQADLVAATEEHEMTVAAIEAAHRAERVLPVLRIAEAAAGELDRIRTAVLARHESVPDQPVALLDTERTRLRELTDERARARTLIPQHERLLAVRSQLGKLTSERAADDTRLREAEARRSALPERVTALRDELQTARAAPADLVTARDRLAALRRVDELTSAQVEARTEYDVARSRSLELRERALDVRQARLDSIAAELAGDLAVGASCPVCGSAEHPHKASRPDGSPDADADKAAQKAADDASAEEHARHERLRDLETQLALARQQAGDAGSAATLEDDVVRLTALAERLPVLETDVTAAEKESEALGVEVTELTARLSDVDSSLRHLTEERDTLSAALDAAIGESGAEDLDSLVYSLDAACEAAQASVAELEALVHALSAHVEAERSVATAATEAGFGDAAGALDAVLAPDVLDDLTANAKHHDRRLAAVRAVLAEPGAAELAEQPLPDLDALATAHRSTLDARTAAQASLSRWVTRLARLTSLEHELGQRLDAWGPLRADLDLATRMAQFAEGKSADNQLQMSLSAYVVAYRLTQVVAAANERLAAMSDRRYSLEHSAKRGAGDRRGGLALLIRDDWSGDTRDPATLSGGETFVVSLALALGLADVITEEAGGADLDTLFVDEGFGSLDADTLDDVMDVLDSLRDGGRVVGVVSHVAEMRDRIPVQLVVDKRRGGSTLAIV